MDPIGRVGHWRGGCGRRGVAVAGRFDGSAEIVKKMKLVKRTAKLALPLLASGAIEPPARPLDVPRCPTRKK